MTLNFTSGSSYSDNLNFVCLLTLAFWQFSYVWAHSQICSVIPGSNLAVTCLTVDFIPGCDKQWNWLKIFHRKLLGIYEQMLSCKISRCKDYQNRVHKVFSFTQMRWMSVLNWNIFKLAKLSLGSSSTFLFKCKYQWFMMRKNRKFSTS